MPPADDGQAGRVADALWRCLRPSVVEGLAAALRHCDADGPDAELTPQDCARADAASARIRHRMQQPARTRHSSASHGESKPSQRSARPMRQGGQP